MPEKPTSRYDAITARIGAMNFGPEGDSRRERSIKFGPSYPKLGREAVFAAQHPIVPRSFQEGVQAVVAAEVSLTPVAELV